MTRAACLPEKKTAREVARAVLHLGDEILSVVFAETMDEKAQPDQHKSRNGGFGDCCY